MWLPYLIEYLKDSERSVTIGKFCIRGCEDYHTHDWDYVYESEGFDQMQNLLQNLKSVLERKSGGKCRLKLEEGGPCEECVGGPRCILCHPAARF